MQLGRNSLVIVFRARAGPTKETQEKLLNGNQSRVGHHSDFIQFSSTFSVGDKT